METFQFQGNTASIGLQVNVLGTKGTTEYHFDTTTHQADYFEIVFFKKAKGYVLLDERRVELKDNTILFISPLQKRRWFVKEKNLSGSVIGFKKDFLNQLFDDKLFSFRLQYLYNCLQATALEADATSAEKYYGLVQDIEAEIKHYQSDSGELLRSMIHYLLLQLNRAYAEAQGLSHETMGNAYAYKFKLLLEASIRVRHLVDEYAEMLDVSRITLNKVVKEQFGVTASEMIRERLLLEVKNELRHSEQTVSQVARGLNFSEPNHMMRFFKNYSGQTPTEFRTAYKAILEAELAELAKAEAPEADKTKKVKAKATKEKSEKSKGKAKNEKTKTEKTKASKSKTDKTKVAKTKASKPKAEKAKTKKGKK